MKIAATNDEYLALLKPKLTDEFLATLTDVARFHGWCGDYVEVADFVREVHSYADKPRPLNETLEPYEFSDDHYLPPTK